MARTWAAPGEHQQVEDFVVAEAGRGRVGAVQALHGRSGPGAQPAGPQQQPAGMPRWANSCGMATTATQPRASYTAPPSHLGRLC
jgi:hypothetical protein